MGSPIKRPWTLYLGVVCLLAGLVHLTLGGSIGFSLSELFLGLGLGPNGEATAAVVLWKLRLPRMFACFAVGGILGVVGGCFQAYFRNPLAEPFVLGVSSGAAAAGTLMILVGIDGVFGGGLMLIGGALGGMATLLAVFWLGGGFGKRTDVVRLLLAGVVIGSMLSAVVTLLMLMAGEDTNQVLRWLLGSMTPMYWIKVGVLWGVLLVGSVVLYRNSRLLNAVAFDGDSSGRLGVDVKKVSRVVLGVGTAMVGVTVGSVGIIGFVGLVAPHIARGLVGADLRRVLPVAGLVGAVLVTLADFGAQKLLAGGELPVGAVTAILGAPVLLVIARKSRERLGSR